MERPADHEDAFATAPVRPGLLPTSSQRAERSNDVFGSRDVTTDFPLATLWEDLIAGRCRVVDAYFSKTHCYVTTVGVPIDQRKRLEGRLLDILERSLLAPAQKHVALDLNLAPSTVAMMARTGLERLGIGSRASRVHPLLVLAVHASRRRERVLNARRYDVWKREPLSSYSIPRPERCVSGVISPAELSVVQGLVEGHSYAQIAQRRGTSTRTVANQVAAVFRRLHVSGRSQLLHCLFERGELASDMRLAS